MRFLALALVGLMLAAPAAAQETPRVDVERLPIDVRRIHRELKQAQDVEERDGLNLRFVVQIYGTAPPIELFMPDANLVHGPVPYGAPTHQEILNHITPQEFRSPVMDFSALVRWLADRSRKNKQQ